MQIQSARIRLGTGAREMCDAEFALLAAIFFMYSPT